MWRALTLLGLARDEGWRVVHSQYRGEAVAPWPRELFGAPIEGLRGRNDLPEAVPAG